jgi:hypothetical protein
MLALSELTALLDKASINCIRLENLQHY